MNTRQFKILAVACIVLAGFAFSMSHVAYGKSGDEKLMLVTRSRAPLADDASRFRVVQNKVEWAPKQTAIIICDMWNQHWCKGATERVAELAPHMNRVVRLARDKGVLSTEGGQPARRHRKMVPMDRRQ
ncbi:MAG: hypothetical protein ACYTAO_10340 [Planctomycetota bacterium]|jgi:hypothetical protein